MRNHENVWTGRSWVLSVLSVLCVGAGASNARAGEIESLLQRGLPTSLDPAAGIGPGRAYPLQQLTRQPFYGLPSGFVDTTTGRLAFKVQDLVLPGRLPIVISHFLDTGLAADLPVGCESDGPALYSALGPNWALSYSEYLQTLGGDYLLVSAEDGAMRFVPQSPGSSVYVKNPEFASNHLQLQIVDGTEGTTIDETRADGSTWRYVRDDSGHCYQLTTVTDRHGNTIQLTYDAGEVVLIQNSSGSWVAFKWGGVGEHQRIVVMYDSVKREIEFEYNDDGFLKAWTADAGGIQVYEYNGFKEGWVDDAEKGWRITPDTSRRRTGDNGTAWTCLV